MSGGGGGAGPTRWGWPARTPMCENRPRQQGQRPVGLLFIQKYLHFPVLLCFACGDLPELPGCARLFELGRPWPAGAAEWPGGARRESVGRGECLFTVAKFVLPTENMQRAQGCCFFGVVLFLSQGGAALWGIVSSEDATLCRVQHPPVIPYVVLDFLTAHNQAHLKCASWTPRKCYTTTFCLRVVVSRPAGIHQTTSRSIWHPLCVAHTA